MSLTQYSAVAITSALVVCSLFAPLSNGAQHGTFSSAGHLSAPREMATAVRLPDGTVLVQGGLADARADIYDPTSGAVAQTQNSSLLGRNQATASLLPNGKVLIAGGCAGGSKGAKGVYGIPTDQAELYDPATMQFARTGNLLRPRYRATSTVLLSGQVLIVGGDGAFDWSGEATLASAELYDPKTEKFSPVGSLSIGRDMTTATLLPNGKVLVSGGHRTLIHSGEMSGLANSELYEPETRHFGSAANMTTPRWGATATLLLDGRVLIAGGDNELAGTNMLDSAEIYDPKTDSFSPTGNMLVAREFAAASLLSDGDVLIVGGTGRKGYVSNAERYVPALGKFVDAGEMLVPRSKATIVALPAGKALIAGGFAKQGLDRTIVEIYADK